MEINRARSSLDTAAVLDSASPAAAVGVLPLPQALLFGALAGFATAAGIALLLEYLGDAIRGPEDVLEIAGVGPLAAVGPLAPARGKRRRAEIPLVARDHPRSPTAEAFRSLRTNLQLAAIEHPMRSLVVTSAGPNEGKTLVDSNLAIVLAQSGKRVLLVDADLRKPEVHTVFGISNDQGLLTALVRESTHTNGTGRAPAEQPLDGLGVVPSGVENLWLLPSGGVPPNPSELLGSTTMLRLVERLAGHFDVLLFDSPPVGPVADALLLSAFADGTLVVARAGQTRRTALRGGLEALQAAAKLVLGVVLNDLRPGPLTRYSPYGYYYSGYYGTHQPTEASQAAANGHVPAPSDEVRAAEEAGRPGRRA